MLDGLKVERGTLAGSRTATRPYVNSQSDSSHRGAIGSQWLGKLSGIRGGEERQREIKRFGMPCVALKQAASWMQTTKDLARGPNSNRRYFLLPSKSVRCLLHRQLVAKNRSLQLLEAVAALLQDA